MSLIQEALKRQQEESGSRTAPVAEGGDKPAIRIRPKQESASPPPPAAALGPDEPIETDAELETEFLLPGEDAIPAEGTGLRLRSRALEEAAASADTDGTQDGQDDEAETQGVRVKPGSDRHRNPVLHLLGLMIVLLLFIAGGGWAILYGLQLLRREAAPEPAAPIAAARVPRTVTAEPVPPPTRRPDDPAGPDAPAGETAAEASTGQPHQVADAPPTEQTPAGEDSLAQDAETDRHAHAGVAPVPSPLAPAPAQPEEEPQTPVAVTWPYLQITGVVGSGETGSAIINGRIIDVGMRIDGVKLVGLSGQAARLEYQSQEKLVRVGRSTE